MNAGTSVLARREERRRFSRSLMMKRVGIDGIVVAVVEGGRRKRARSKSRRKGSSALRLAHGCSRDETDVTCYIHSAHGTAASWVRHQTKAVFHS